MDEAAAGVAQKAMAAATVIVEIDFIRVSCGVPGNLPTREGAAGELHSESNATQESRVKTCASRDLSSKDLTVAFTASPGRSLRPPRVD
jgi:hypothetical protein